MTKKNLLKIILSLFILVIAILVVNNMTRTKHSIEYRINPDLPVLKEGWQGNIVIDGRFRNYYASQIKSFSDAFRWMLSRNPQREEKRNDSFRLQVQEFNPAELQENSLVWLGHDTFLMNLNGIRLMTDPIFFNLPNNRRQSDLPCSVDDLTPIDYLLVSHCHRDHFDMRSVRALVRNNPEMKALVPLGGSSLFNNRHLRNVEVQEAGWFQEYDISDDIRIIFLPVKHWGRRGLTDTNRVLWGSFLIITPETSIFFGGDLAYDQQKFKTIRELFGDIDICIFPIGAYSPAWFMSQAHVNPEEAIQAFLDLGGSVFIPMHFGTFDLSDEPMGEPIRRLHQKAMEIGIEHKIRELAVGEELLIVKK